MNISYHWLRSLAPGITDSPQALAERLGMLGAPVDELVEIAAELGDVVIARVTEVREHPNADRLRLCTVQAGAEALQVVCGAPNVRAGGYYPFAPVGAALPGGLKIRKAKLRGEVSEGMLCSARELGLGREHAGILELSGQWEEGQPFVSTLGLDDARLDVDVTANRPDLLSHLGVARELADGGESALRLPPFPEQKEAPLRLSTDERRVELNGIAVSIEDSDLCPRYMAAVLRGVRVGPSPEWLAMRLRAIGVRPVNNVVDATNYVLFELGQPLHAFDLDKLAGPEIRVRRAAAGESIRTLDGEDRTLDEEMLVIADAQAPVAIAGVMGGEDSEVTADTTDVLLECALFDEKAVRRTARALGLSTDASYRFERGVDPEGLPRALERVASLVITVAGGELDPAAADAHPRPFSRRTVEVRPDRVERVLGVGLPAARIAELLRPIGFAAESEAAAGTGAGATVRVEVPGFRPDVTREIDVIEEVARRRGYDSFPERIAAFRPSNVPAEPLTRTLGSLRQRLAASGMLEARTVSFAPAAERRVPLLSPLSAEESHLRDELLPGLLRRLEHNWAHGIRDVRLFEIGTAFFPTEGDVPPREELRLAAVFTGSRRPPHWSEPREAYDIWDLKGLLSELADELRMALRDGGDTPDAAAANGGPAESRSPGEASFGSAAGVIVKSEALRLSELDGRAELGLAGRIAEGAVDAPAWAEPVWGLEVRLRVPPPLEVRYTPLPEQPASERDLALILPPQVTASAVERVAREAAGPLLQDVWPFDVYEGKGIPEGHRSVAWRLRYRAPDRTLKDEEVDESVRSILDSLKGELSVHRR